MRHGRATISLRLKACNTQNDATVFRLSPTGERAGTVSVHFAKIDPLAADSSCREGKREAPPSRVVVSFTADTAIDPSCATIFYEIVR